jgi:plastocyanin
MLVLALGACSGKSGSDADQNTPVASAAAAPTGKVITVEMITDETGSYFKPRDIEAKAGDILRFTLTSGVHNVHFVADSNKGITGLPAAGELLQLPGQTTDVTVPDAAGKKLYFHCDPHALLGMIGYVTIGS